MKDKIEKYAVMYGYVVREPNVTGYLKVNTSGKELYDFVDDVKYATKFPYKNSNKTKGFAKPEKWLEFFEEEESLKDWCFHIVKMQRKHVN